MSTFKNEMFGKRVENTFVIWVYKLKGSRLLETRLLTFLLITDVTQTTKSNKVNMKIKRDFRIHTFSAVSQHY